MGIERFTNRSKIIMRTLGHIGEATYNKLYDIIRTEMARQTYHNTLKTLIEKGFINRDPPLEPRIQKGKSVTLTLSEEGKKFVTLMDILTKTEKNLYNALESLVDKTVQAAEAKPLPGAVFFVETKVNNYPFGTFTIIPSREYYKKWRLKIRRKDIGRELASLIQTVTKDYLDDTARQTSIPLPQKNSLWFSCFFPEAETNKIQRLVSEGFFRNELELASMLTTIAFNVLDHIYDKLLTKQEYREGKAIFEIPLRGRYNPENKRIEPIAKTRNQESA